MIVLLIERFRMIVEEQIYNILWKKEDEMDSEWFSLYERLASCLDLHVPCHVNYTMIPIAEIQCAIQRSLQTVDTNPLQHHEIWSLQAQLIEHNQPHNNV